MARFRLMRRASLVCATAALFACDDVPLLVSTTRLPPLVNDAGTPSTSRDGGAGRAEDAGLGAFDAASCPWEDPSQAEPGSPLAAPLPFECGELPPRDAALVAVTHAKPVVACGGPEPETAPSHGCGYHSRLQALVSEMVLACASSFGLSPLHCAQLMLGVRGGVVVDTTITGEANDEPPCFYACLREHLIGQRFSCAPSSDVWTLGMAGVCGPPPP